MANKVVIIDTICIEGTSYWSLEVEEYFKNILHSNYWILLIFSFVTSKYVLSLASLSHLNISIKSQVSAVPNQTVLQLGLAGSHLLQRSQMFC